MTPQAMGEYRSKIGQALGAAAEAQRKKQGLPDLTLDQWKFLTEWQTFNRRFNDLEAFTQIFVFSLMLRYKKLFNVHTPPSFQTSLVTNYKSPEQRKQEWQDFVAQELKVIKKGETLSFSSDDSKKTYLKFRECCLSSNHPLELLGLETQDKKLVEKVYRRLSLVVSPDKHGNNEEATSLFKILQEAYRILLDT
jgi:hypothetical protein